MGLALKGDGALLPDGGLAHLLHDVKELFPPPIVLSPVSALYLPFPVTPQAAWGKWWADTGERTMGGGNSSFTS